jgi:hypothetical protein
LSKCSELAAVAGHISLRTNSALQLCDIYKSTVVVEGFQVLPLCPCGKDIIKVKMNI